MVLDYLVGFVVGFQEKNVVAGMLADGLRTISNRLNSSDNGLEFVYCMIRNQKYLTSNEEESYRLSQAIYL